MLLAETVSIDGGLLLLILGVLMGLVAVWVGAAIAGFRYAARAGRGENGAMGWWIVTLVLQGILSAVTLFSIGIVGVVLIGLQVVSFRRARRGAEGMPRP